MTSQAWLDANNRYLADALAWLRARLGWLATRDDASGPSETDQQLAAAAARMETAELVDSPPALILLGQVLSLSRFECHVLLLCAAVELDPRIPGLCARAAADPSASYPTFALALALFDEPAWDVLSPNRGLRYWRLVEISQAAGQPLTTSPLRADERILNYLKGLNELDDRIGRLLAPVHPGLARTTQPAGSQQAAVDAILQRWAQASPDAPLPVVVLVGPDALGKQAVATSAAAFLGRHLHRIPIEALPAQTDVAESLSLLLQREALLLPIALLLDADDIEEADGSGGQAVALRQLLTGLHAVVFVAARQAWPRLGRSAFTVDIARPTPAEQQAAWQAELGPEAEAMAGRLAAQFSLDLHDIAEIGTALRAPAGVVQGTDGSALGGQCLEMRVWQACLARARPRLDALAQRLEPRSGWDDIVLPSAELALLHQIAAQVGQRSTVYASWGFGARMNRGLGISALFAGPSGTGKTMAAEVMARHLNLHLYRIDLSAVVSKYIGETEKNLRRLFDAAEEGGAVLFFDEADALFGKRSEVKDSHDRYANIEVNYLLQRMEAYGGLAILATNQKNALDPAFLRRLRFIVAFPYPGVAERKAIWAHVFPPDTPTTELDLDRLARLPASGGEIHNIALNAAFLAAHRDAPVSMRLVLEAARGEFRKLQQPVSDADLNWREEVARR